MCLCLRDLLIDDLRPSHDLAAILEIAVAAALRTVIHHGPPGGKATVAAVEAWRADAWGILQDDKSKPTQQEIIREALSLTMIARWVVEEQMGAAKNVLFVCLTESPKPQNMRICATSSKPYVCGHLH